MQKPNLGYEQFATETQWKYYTALCELGTMRAVGKKYGKNHSTISESIKCMKRRAAKKNFDPDNGSTRVVAEGFEVLGTSTMTRNEHGEIQWVKTKQELVDFEKKIARACSILSEDVKGKSCVPEVDSCVFDHDKLSVYPVTDLHVGMLAWGKECGEDQDLNIISAIADHAVGQVVAAQPKSVNSIVCFMGDYFHSDDDTNTTSHSGNNLDCDGRTDKAFEIGIRIAKNIIEKVASKHENVKIVVLPGNHDEYLSMSLKYVLQAYYCNNPRITLEMTHGVFAYHEFGNTLLAFTHGHTVKPAKMHGVIVEDQREAWGRVKMCHCITGHIHHQSVIDEGSCKIETFRTLAAKDAWSSAGGYRAPRTMFSLTYDILQGECGRAQYNILAPDESK